MSFPIHPQTPDLDMSPVITLPHSSVNLSQAKETPKQTKLQLPEAPGSSWGGAGGLPGRQVGLLHILLCLPGEKLPATQAQGLHPEQGVSGSTFYLEPEPQACPFWYTEDSTPQGLSQNLLSATISILCL